MQKNRENFARGQIISPDSDVYAGNTAVKFSLIDALFMLQRV